MLSDKVRCRQTSQVIGTKGGGGFCLCQSEEQCAILIERELDRKKAQERKD